MYIAHSQYVSVKNSILQPFPSSLELNFPSLLCIVYHFLFKSVGNTKRWMWCLTDDERGVGNNLSVSLKVSSSPRHHHHNHHHHHYLPENQQRDKITSLCQHRNHHHHHENEQRDGIYLFTTHIRAFPDKRCTQLFHRLFLNPMQSFILVGKNKQLLQGVFFDWSRPEKF